MISRRSFIASGAILPALSPTFLKNMAEEKQRAVALEITEVESFVIRNPNDETPSDELIEMPPVGALKGQPGLGQRLNHASPSRFKGYQQTLLVKIHTKQGITGWGEAHAPAAPRVHQKVILIY